MTCGRWATTESVRRGRLRSAIESEQLEAEPNETVSAAMSVPLDVVINGRIDKAGDSDHFRFDAKRGQRVVIECWAERIDSRLRAVLEIFDASGRRLAVNRGYFGIDPLIDFRVPADGSYVVKIQDLIVVGECRALLPARHRHRTARGVFRAERRPARQGGTRRVVWLELGSAN